MHKPILFIHSKVDVFSLPDKAQLLYEMCPSERKKFVFFDKGRHSFVRINNPEKYDETVIGFLNTL
jgi:esterase/lipase